MSSKSEIRRIYFNNFENSIKHLRKLTGKQKELTKEYMLGYLQGMEFSEMITSLEYHVLGGQIQEA